MKNNFPYIALSIGLFFSLVLFKGSQLNEDGTTLFPLLGLLTICELSFFVTAIGAYIGIKHIRINGLATSSLLVSIACVLLAIQFIFQGIALWPS